ncbi:FhuF 2Fe-2S C-terminal domain-containing protein [Streptomyces sp. 2112.3]|uniref:(2Fe-2S)-binding protein n=1 Tax=Streptomyces sp. 2112.3 TaxID=1881023 RepID=UPI00089BD0A7|nr:(2Fe-2S)-binding protein [Streptomyces sp. 2112.3]SEF13432.1 FhuF 2Fe-2S C-terminal domain-containing protein [Streptomyces sp. 2112.3]
MTEPTAARQAQVAALGPFFAFETHPATSELASPWRPLSEVAREDSGVLRERVTAVRASLAARSGRPAEAVELRVAASVAHLGLVARVLSPMLGLTALHGLRLPSPPPTLDDLRWHSGLGGAFALSLPRETVASLAAGSARCGSGPSSHDGAHARIRTPADTDADTDVDTDTSADADTDTDADADADAVENLLDGPIRELVDAAASFSVSPRILWGNVASAVNGAATGMVSAAPSLARPARTAALLFLSRPQLQDTHTLNAPNGRFRRRSCCLIYRAAPNASGSLCGDCVLARPQVRRSGPRP